MIEVPRLWICLFVDGPVPKYETMASTGGGRKSPSAPSFSHAIKLMLYVNKSLDYNN